MTVMINND